MALNSRRTRGMRNGMGKKERKSYLYKAKSKTRKRSSRAFMLGFWRWGLLAEGFIHTETRKWWKEVAYLIGQLQDLATYPRKLLHCLAEGLLKVNGRATTVEFNVSTWDNSYIKLLYSHQMHDSYLIGTSARTNTFSWPTIFQQQFLLAIFNLTAFILALWLIEVTRRLKIRALHYAWSDNPHS